MVQKKKSVQDPCVHILGAGPFSCVYQYSPHHTLAHIRHQKYIIRPSFESIMYAARRCFFVLTVILPSRWTYVILNPDESYRYKFEWLVMSRKLSCVTIIIRIKKGDPSCSSLTGYFLTENTRNVLYTHFFRVPIHSFLRGSVKSKQTCRTKVYYTILEYYLSFSRTFFYFLHYTNTFDSRRD